MKSFFEGIVFIGLVFLAQVFYAQELNIPRASPKAEVSLMVGVNKVSVQYASPSARGRKIFGNLVPYDKVWRAGANEATTITFEKSVNFGGIEVSGGTYGLFMIPSKDTWIVILNRIGNQWGAYHYDQNDDVLRLKITPVKIPMVESCTYSFEDISKTKATLFLKWENVGIPIVLSTNTEKQALEEIETHLKNVNNSWYSYSAAAQYHFYELEENEKALEYIDKAIDLNAPNPAPWMLKSQIFEKQEKYEQAIKNAQKAIEISKEYNFYFEIHENEEQIEKWRRILDKK